MFSMIIVNFNTVMHASSNSGTWWLSLFNVLDGRASAAIRALGAKPEVDCPSK